MPIILIILFLVSVGGAVAIVTPMLIEIEDPAVTQERTANETDPLTSLTAPVPSTRWGEQFWSAQAKAQTPLFLQAKDYCRQGEHKDSPNCKTVNLVGWLNAPRKPVPEYGSQGFGKMPTVGEENR